MNFDQQQTHSKLPGLAFVIAMHAVVFSLVIKTIHDRSFQPPTEQVIDLLPMPIPTPKIPEPVEKKTELKSQKQTIFQARPEVAVKPQANNDAPPIITTDKGHEVDHLYNNGDKEVVLAKVETRQTVHIAAVVDARNCEKPEYPRNALRNGDTGIVTLAMLIGTDGRVIDSRVEKSSGVRDLDKAAQQGLSLCKFKPGSIDGVAQQSWTTIQYAWKLD